jgi:hypothetical protein
MQGLEHEAVAAQRDDNVSLVRPGIVMAGAHVGKRLGGIGRGGEM